MTAPPERTEEKKLKSKGLDQLYLWYLQGKDYKAVLVNLASRNQPGMSELDWEKIKAYFRYREAKFPNKMALIRQKIGWTTRG